MTPGGVWPPPPSSESKQSGLGPCCISRHRAADRTGPWGLPGSTWLRCASQVLCKNEDWNQRPTVWASSCLLTQDSPGKEISRFLPPRACPLPSAPRSPLPTQRPLFLLSLCFSSFPRGCASRIHWALALL